MQDGDFRAQLQASLGAAYTLERELGGGGMSRVFVARENALDRPVVIKVLPPDMAQGVSIQRFTREIRVAARLQHAHVVPLLASGALDGLPWYTMPFIEGESLRARLVRGGELPITDAIRILREIASALAYAHARGIVHRDIKPENVLLSEGVALVADFGVAKALADAGEAAGIDLTSRGVALGTPTYMAPEQAIADPRTDQRADVYAFGVMAYEILAGRTPFAGRSPQATLAAHITETPEPVERVRSSTPPALAALVMQCLAKSPADRPQNAVELVHALDALVTPTSTAPALSPVGGVAALSPSTPQHEAGGTRNKRRGIAAAVLLVVLAAGGSYGWTRLSSNNVRGRRIAVAPFKNETGDPQFDVFGRYIADFLTRELSRDTTLDVASTTAVSAAMSGLAADVNRIERLRKALNASIVVDGSLYLKGDSISVQTTIADSRTEKPLRTIDATSAPKSSPTDAVETLRERVLGALEVDRIGWFQGRAPRLAAYRELALALEVWSKDYDVTREALHRAISIDSTLFLAYSSLAVVLSAEHMWDSAEVVTQEWGRFKNQFSPEERDLFEFQLAILEGDFEKALSANLRLAEHDPTGVPRFHVGLYAKNALHARQAIAALEQSDSAMSARFAPIFQVRQLAAAYHLADEHEREQSMLQKKRAAFPDDPLVLSWQLYALAGLHRAAEAAAIVDTLLRGTTEPNDLVPYFVASSAAEFEAHGDSRTAQRIARLCLEWFVAHPTASPTLYRLLGENTARLVADSLGASRAPFGKGAGRRVAIALADSVEIIGFHGLGLARLRDSARARAIADSLGALDRKWLFGRHTFWRGAIYGELGDKEAAVRLLRQAYQQGYGKESWHSHAALRALRGFPPFQALIKPVG